MGEKWGNIGTTVTTIIFKKGFFDKKELKEFIFTKLVFENKVTRISLSGKDQKEEKYNKT